MKAMQITSAADRDNLEPLFIAAIEHNLTFSTFTYNDDNLITFTLNFPSNFTEADFASMCRDNQLDELCDMLPES
jgi:hypothetical protein